MMILKGEKGAIRRKIFLPGMNQRKEAVHRLQRERRPQEICSRLPAGTGKPPVRGKQREWSIIRFGIPRYEEPDQNY